jgi:hypothetical protein
MKRVSLGYGAGVLLLLLMAMPVDGLAGRGDKAGTSAAPELLIPVGARDLAQGGASIAMSSGVEAIYWNPAGLSRGGQSSEAIFSHMDYIADIGVDYIAIGTSFEGFGSLGLSLKSLSIGDIAVTTEDAPDGTGAIFSPTYVTVGLTYSRLLTDRISVGVTGNIISERIDRVSATGVAFDIGLQYSAFASVSGLNIGIAIKNVGPAMSFSGSGLLRAADPTDVNRPSAPLQIQAASDELPSTIELGVGYSYQIEEEHVLSAATLFQNNNLSDDEYKVGLEYGFDRTFFLRGGWNFSQETYEDSYIYGPTVGAGIHYAFSGLEATIDYAFRDVDFFDGNHVFSIKLGF